MPSQGPRLRDALVLVAIFAPLFVALKARQFAGFGLGFELADYETMIRSVLHGRLLHMPGTATSFLADHFSPILLLVAPLYALAPSPWTLLVLHALATAAAVVPLHVLASGFTDRRWPPVAMGLAYLLSRVVLNGLMYDVHPEVLYPACFFTAFAALERRRWAVYAVTLGLAATVKEDAFVAIAGLGAFALLRGHVRSGLATLVTALAGLVLVVALVMPHYRPEGAGGEYRFVSYWSGYGATQQEILRNFLDPVRHLRVIFTPDKLRQMFNLFSVFLFLPLVSWRGAVALVLPNWFLLYSSDNGLLNGPILYYGMLITPFLFYSALLGMEALGGRRPVRSERLLAMLATLVLAVHAGNSRLPRLVAGALEPVPARYADTATRLARSLPAGVRVCAQVALLPHVSADADRTCFPMHLDRADVVFLDLEGNPWPFTREGLARAADSLRASSTWRTRVNDGGFVVLERAAGPR